MKIYRGPRKGDIWQPTDSKKPSEYAKHWVPGEPLTLDGTIDKTGKRHTSLGLELDEADIAALFNALVERSRKLREIEKEAEKLWEDLGQDREPHCYSF